MEDKEFFAWRNLGTGFWAKVVEPLVDGVKENFFFKNPEMTRKGIQILRNYSYFLDVSVNSIKLLLNGEEVRTWDPKTTDTEEVAMYLLTTIIPEIEEVVDGFDPSDESTKHAMRRIGEYKSRLEALF